MGLPIIVTVREPRSAALSLIRRWPHITALQALRWYIRFYRTLLPYAAEVVVSPFSSTTGSLDKVIEEVNERFGTSFDLFTHDLESTRAVRGSAEQIAEKRENAEKMKSSKVREFDAPKAQALLAEAESIYRQFLENRAVTQ